MTIERIQFRRGTAAEWVAVNPILAEGEPGYETDTGREKRGDGVTHWNNLDYVTDIGDLQPLSEKGQPGGYAALIDDGEGRAILDPRNMPVIGRVWIAEEWGVVGDGVTNDEPALSALIERVANAGGGTILIQSPVVLLGDALVWLDKVRIKGGGIDITTLKAAASAGNLIDWSARTNVGLSDLTIDGNSPAGQPAASDGLYASTVSSSYLTRVKFKNTTGWGINIADGDTVWANALEYESNALGELNDPSGAVQSDAGGGGGAVGQSWGFRNISGTAPQVISWNTPPYTVQFLYGQGAGVDLTQVAAGLDVETAGLYIVSGLVWVDPSGGNSISPGGYMLRAEITYGSSVWYQSHPFVDLFSDDVGVSRWFPTQPVWLDAGITLSVVLYPMMAGGDQVVLANAELAAVRVA